MNFLDIYNIGITVNGKTKQIDIMFFISSTFGVNLDSVDSLSSSACGKIFVLVPEQVNLKNGFPPLAIIS